MVNAPNLENVLAQALRLAPKERLRLIEQVAASVEQDISAASESPSPEHWGKALNRLIDSLEPVELIHPEIDDPVDWLNQLRREQSDRLNPYWDEET